LRGARPKMDTSAPAPNPFLDTLSNGVVHGAQRATHRAATAPVQSIRISRAAGAGALRRRQPSAPPHACASVLRRAALFGCRRRSTHSAPERVPARRRSQHAPLGAAQRSRARGGAPARPGAGAAWPGSGAPTPRHSRMRSNTPKHTPGASALQPRARPRRETTAPTRRAAARRAF
jgi:hypothetical protein